MLRVKENTYASRVAAIGSRTCAERHVGAGCARDRGGACCKSARAQRGDREVLDGVVGRARELEQERRRLSR